MEIKKELALSMNKCLITYNFTLQHFTSSLTVDSLYKIRIKNIVFLRELHGTVASFFQVSFLHHMSNQSFEMNNAILQEDRMIEDEQKVEASQILDLIALSSKSVEEGDFRNFRQLLRKIYNMVTKSSLNYDKIFSDSMFPSFLLQILHSLFENDEFDFTTATSIVLTIKALMITSKELTQFFIKNGFIDLCLELVHPPLNALIGSVTEILVLIIKGFPQYSENIYSRYDYVLIYELLKTYLDVDRMNKFIKTILLYIIELIKNDCLDIPIIVQILTFALSLESDACHLILLALTMLIEKKIYTVDQLCENGLLDSVSAVLESATDRDIVSISNFFIFLIDNGLSTESIPIVLFSNKLRGIHSEESITIILKLFGKISFKSPDVFVEDGIVNSLISLINDHDMHSGAILHAAITIANAAINESTQERVYQDNGICAITALSLSLESFNYEYRVLFLRAMIVLSQLCISNGQIQVLQEALADFFESDGFDPMETEDEELYFQFKEIVFPE